MPVGAAPSSFPIRWSQAEATTADYTEPSGKLTIPAGRVEGYDCRQHQGRQRAGVRYRDLGLAAETIAVRLDSADTTAANNPTATGTSAPPTTIRDSDGTVVVSVADAAPVTEGQAAVFTVSLSGKVSQNVTVTAQTDPSAGTGLRSCAAGAACDRSGRDDRQVHRTDHGRCERPTRGGGRELSRSRCSL